MSILDYLYASPRPLALMISLIIRQQRDSMSRNRQLHRLIYDLLEKMTIVEITPGTTAHTEQKGIKQINMVKDHEDYAESR